MVVVGRVRFLTVAVRCGGVGRVRFLMVAVPEQGFRTVTVRERMVFDFSS